MAAPVTAAARTGRGLLYVVHELPYPARAGHHRRYAEIAGLVSGFGPVRLFGFAEDGPRDGCAGPVRFEGVAGEMRIRRRPLLLARALTQALVRRQAYSTAKYRGGPLAEALARSGAPAPGEIVLTSLFTERFVPVGIGPRVLDMHNVESDLWSEFARLHGGLLGTLLRREARALRREEIQAYERCDGIIAISAEDASRIAAATDTPIAHVPVALDFDPISLSGGPETFDVGMIGVWSWQPNVDALYRFVDRVLPGLLRRGLRVRVAGLGLPPSLRTRLQRAGVCCPGFVPDARTFYANVRVVAAPYLLGGGVRMKVAEALSHGRQVIGTPLSFRGIGPGVPTGWVVPDDDAMVDALVRAAAAPEPVPDGLYQAHARSLRQAALDGLIEAAAERAAKRVRHDDDPASAGVKRRLFA